MLTGSACGTVLQQVAIVYQPGSKKLSQVTTAATNEIPSENLLELSRKFSLGISLVATVATCDSFVESDHCRFNSETV